MRYILSIILIGAISLHCEDFISRFEYGQMLYENPRGVSCMPCHGRKGEGKIIAKYIDSNGKERVVRGSDIRLVSKQDMLKAIHNGPGVMPKYFLTNDEIEAIYEYIQKVNQPEDSSSNNPVIDW